MYRFVYRWSPLNPLPPPFARYTQESGNSVNLVVNLYLLGVVSTIVYEDFSGVRGRLGDRVGEYKVWGSIE